MENSSSSFPAWSVTVSKAKNADFKYRIANGLPLPDLPYSLLIYQAPNALVSSTTYYSGGEVVPRGATLQSLGNNTGYADKDRRDFEARWRARLNNKVLESIKRQSLPLIQLYVERKETASALAKLVDESIFIARNVKRPSKIFKRYGKSTNTKQYRKVRNSVKVLSSSKNEVVGSAWLQYRMFLTPLYHDVMSSLSANADYEKKIHTSSVSASAKFNENLGFRNDTYSLGAPSNREKGTLSVTGGAKMKITYSISDYSLSAVTSVADPLAVGWDLVPWSFIVDRFVDLGSYLELRNATIGTTFRSGCLSYFFEWNGRAETPWEIYYPNVLTWQLHPFGYKTVYSGYENLTFKEISTGRIVMTSYPPVTLEYPFRQGWKQITDEIVLLRQLLGKRLR